MVIYKSQKNRIKKYHEGKLGGRLHGSTDEPQWGVLCMFILAYFTLLGK